MKIVFLSVAAQGGGAEVAFLEIMKAVREHRPSWELHLILGEDGEMQKKAETAGVACELLPFPAAVRRFGESRAYTIRRDGWVERWLAKAGRLAGAFFLLMGTVVYLWKLRARLRRLRPDLVHSSGMKMHLLGALAKPDVPLVWSMQDYLGLRLKMRPLLRRLAGRCQLVMGCSESVAADVRAVLPSGPQAVAVYNMFDMDAFTSEGAAIDLDALAGLPPAAPGILKVGLVATFARWKGHDTFLQAVARIAATPVGASARFYVVGGPVYATAGSQRTLNELRAIAAALGIGGVVGFTGFVEDSPAAMRALGIVVHASTQPEPFGLVIAQAMACGRAVVVSDAGGARELVEPGVDALTHPPGDAVALADAIERLIADPELRSRLGKSGMTHARRRFGRQAVGAAILPLFERFDKTQPPLCSSFTRKEA